MVTNKRTVWEVAEDVRQIVHDMNLARWHPKVEISCLVGLRSVELEILSPTRRETLQVVKTITHRLRQRYPDWRDFLQVSLEDGRAVMVIDQEHILETF